MGEAAAGDRNAAAARRADREEERRKKREEEAKRRGPLALLDDAGNESEMQAAAEAFAQLSFLARANTETETIDFDKSAFLDVTLHGQFNLGFILGSWRGQLFVFDQHACDEKRRFERLNEMARIEVQPLLEPLQLRFAPSQEQTVESNMHVFRANGFDLEVDPSRPPGERVRARGLPVTDGGATFGPRDIEELVAALEEEGRSHPGGQVIECAPIGEEVVKGGGIFQTRLVIAAPAGAARQCWGAVSRFPRPRKVWALLASKACRSAIMVGKGLRESDQYDLVRSLSSLSQPWNCPHGRPTLRHLINLRTVAQYKLTGLLESPNESKTPINSTPT